MTDHANTLEGWSDIILNNQIKGEETMPSAERRAAEGNVKVYTNKKDAAKREKKGVISLDPIALASGKAIKEITAFLEQAAKDGAKEVGGTLNCY